MFEKYTYLDNASITRLDERVWEEMKPYFFDIYAIPTSESGYSMGVEAREVLEKSRETIAQKLNAQSSELIFTSGFTESSNIALKGVAMALEKKKGNHIIVSKIEDYSVLNTAQSLEKQGFQVTYLEVDEYGLVDPDILNDQITPETILVSIQQANQEIGTLQDLKSVGEVCNDKGVLFHTDATHTFTRTPLDLEKIPVDLATISAHTIHGPSGIGALYIKRGTSISKWMDGGFQESNRRAGLENIPGAVGFAKAVTLVTTEENHLIQKMRDYLIDRILSEVPKSILNGHPTKRVPQNANITFEYVEGESITLHLDMRGFAVSTGSACFSRSLDPSHVILGIGGDHERAHGSVRFTLGRFTTPEEINAACDSVATVVENLRKISPLGNV
ncbi:cysteine desulfurase family protein [Methanobacterium sp. BAmetb5]|jgi:cysteine desulfurase|uniref:cysteine desulfurase family protein n=1 Tax=Methanobacterium sp. BAmetb5 TaxID=2025351 RepID=UPI000E9089A8|nr:cysteine desulfurase family protein [Methanobacterium sp. BAmetb5]AXV39287.1 MAG: cysteine desulfurase NifS [Methanobacterium sp. BAmetb5]